MYDTLVFDIETQNFFTDPGVGRDNFSALKISVVGAYSYLLDKYFIYEEKEMGELAKLFKDSHRIVGFSINRYDVPVLNHYFQRVPEEVRMNLWEKDRVDLLEEVELAAGQRVSLSKLSEANLGTAKDRHGSEAVMLYNTGQMEELKKYCLKDVELTKQLYDLYRERKYLFVPDKNSGEIMKVAFEVQNAFTPHLF